MLVARVFISEQLDISGETHSLLEAHGIEVRLGRAMWDRPHDAMTDDELIEACQGVDVVMGASRDRFTRRLMEECPGLVLISKYGIGTERIEVDAATELGVLVSNTPVPENYNAVAEHTIALTLALLRRLKSLESHVHRGGWRGPDTIVDSLEGLTVGLLGLGRIAGSVARRLAGWGARLIAYDPYVEQLLAAQLGVELVSFVTLLEHADVLTLHTVVTSETRGVIDAEALARMKPTAFLVNTSRGELVDELALAAALREGRLGGAGLDVTNPEPPALDNELLAFDNVIVSPHTAGWTARTIAAIARAGAENILAVAEGRPPVFLKNPAVLDRPLRAQLESPVERTKD